MKLVWQLLISVICASFLGTAWSQPLTVTTFAGKFSYDGYVNGVGTNALFRGLNDFADLAADAYGFLYVVDGNSIRRISPDRSVVTLAGNPVQAGYKDGLGKNVLFSAPAGIAADANGNVYVADRGNYAIRKISLALAVEVSTVAGDGTSGYVDSAAGNPKFQDPTSVALDSAGNLYVADYITLRKITRDGVVTTLAGHPYLNGFDDGTGTNARFVSPFYLAANADRNIFVGMAGVIRQVTPAGVVSTWVGGNGHQDLDGIGTKAGFTQTYAIALDKAGGVYVADGQAGTIRYVTSAGVVTTVAGTVNRFPYPGSNDGVGANAFFSYPQGIAVDPQGIVYIVDSGEFTVLQGVPPSLPAIGSFEYLTGGVPVYYNNPWKFTATYSAFVSDLRLRVQSTLTTNDPSSWTYLPGEMTHVGDVWTLYPTNVPAGANRYFRAVASAPGYADGPSAALGPETVLIPQLPPIGSFSYSTGGTPIRSSNAWLFSAGYKNLVSDLKLRVQSTLTPNDEGSWTYLPGNLSDVDGNWTLNRTVVPVGTNRYFRVIASAPGYLDRTSAAVGPDTVLDGSVLLADNGFRPNVNGFGFENYGNPPGRTNLTSVEMQRLFGDHVFATVVGPDRLLTPSAQEWMETENKVMGGGHCEGMAVLSVLVYSGVLDTSGFGNPSINGLVNDGNPALQREIALWWATQESDPAASARIFQPPTQILDLLIAALKPGAPETYVLGVRMEGKGGHIVTPYAVKDLGNGFFGVLLYDNNHPNIERRLLIDRVKNTWEYNHSTNPDFAEGLWSGDATTTYGIGIEPNSPRLQTQVCSFCLNTAGAAAAANEIFVGGNQVKILLTDAQGKRYGYDAGKFYQEIPGVTHRMLASGDELWQDSPSPNYYVPVGTAVRMTLDGRAVTNVTESFVTMIGPGYHLSIEDIQLNPHQKDTIAFSPDGKSLAYTPGTSETPTIRLGFETVGSDYDFRIKGVNIEANSTLNIQLDQAGKTLSIHTAGNKQIGTYAFVMGRLDDDHALYFDHEAIKLLPNETATLDYGHWVGNKTTMPLLIDRDSNGTVDETVQLIDEEKIAGTAPSLSAQVVTGGTIKVSWPAWAADYVLEANNTLSATGWDTVPTNQLATEGTNIVFTESVKGSTRFYRLHN